MAGVVRAVRALGPVWAVFTVAMAAVALRDVNDDAMWLVVVAAAVAASAAVAAAAVAGARPRLAGAFLVVAAVASPTFGAVWLNAIPLVGGGFLILRAGPGRPAFS